MRKTRKRNASTFHKISTKIAWNVSEYSGSSQNKKWKSRNTNNHGEIQQVVITDTAYVWTRQIT